MKKDHHHDGDTPEKIYFGISCRAAHGYRYNRSWTLICVWKYGIPLWLTQAFLAEGEQVITGTRSPLQLHFVMDFLHLKVHLAHRHNHLVNYPGYLLNNRIVVLFFILYYNPQSGKQLFIICLQGS